MHVAVIMDGCRRWARNNFKNTHEGHIAGKNPLIALM